MHARIATFEGGRPEYLEIGRRLGREQFEPKLKQMQGFAGHLYLADPDSGRSLGIVLFDSPEALEAGDRELNEMSPPDELEGIRRTSLDRYEVLHHELSGEPQAARVSRLTGTAGQLDDARSTLESTLPRIRSIDGWLGAVAFADVSTGNTVLITLWESMDALRRSEQEADRLRQEAADAMQHRIAGVERYEVLGALIPTGAAAR